MIPVVLAAVSAGFKVAGAIRQGREEQAALEFNAGVARANAAAVKTSNEFDLLRMKLQGKKLRSAQAAGYAKAGVRLEGSPLDVMIESAANVELDMFIEQYNAQTQVSQLMNQASQMEKMGKRAVKNSYFNAATSLLSSASNYYGSK